MERLTDKKEADAQRREYEIRLKQGYPRNIPEERFLRLAAYEDTGLEPEDLKRAFNEDDVLKLAGQALGITPERLRELVQADKEGRCVVFQPGYGVVSIYNPKDEDGLYTMKVTGVITKEEYEAALRREQDG
ncbi:MAG: hypothetical protein ACLRSP_20045 [Flavonifractor plautii]|jgi:hypothetical protein|nr:MAG TPA: hypothetical protein [Caudoviricetes sp.]